jgi:hypothetical protein
MNNSITGTLLYKGKIHRNWLKNFPGNVLTSNKTNIELIIGSASMLFEFVVPVNSATVSIPIVEISTNKDWKYDFTINWGDGTEETVTSFKHVTHTYTTPGTYYVNISGNFYGFDNSTGNGWKYLKRIISWGFYPIFYLDHAFYNVQTLKSIPDTQLPINTVSAEGAFENCISLEKLGQNFNFNPNVKSIKEIFKGTGLVDLRNCLMALPNSLEGKGAEGVFQDCELLKFLPSQLFKNAINLEQITSLNNFCKDCLNLQEIPKNKTGFCIPDAVKTIDHIFQNCISLTNINFELHKNIESAVEAFQNCTQLKTIGENFKFFPGINDLSRIFAGCKNLKEIPETIWPESFNDNTNITEAFSGCLNAVGFLPYWKLWESYNSWSTAAPYTFSNCEKIKNWEYVPQSWGGNYTKSFYPDFEFELTIKESNYTFNLPIKKTYKTWDPTTNSVVEKPCRYGCAIDWGDNSPMGILQLVTDNKHINFNFPVLDNDSNASKSIQSWRSDLQTTEECEECLEPYFGQVIKFGSVGPWTSNGLPNWTNVLLNGVANHVYSTSGTYKVSIKALGDETEYCIDTLYVPAGGTNWEYLTKIFSFGQMHWKSFERAFAGAFNLTRLPNQKPSYIETFDEIKIFFNCDVKERLNFSAWEINDWSTDLANQLSKEYRMEPC